MAVQWLGLCASTAGVTGFIPGQGTEIPQVLQHSKQNKIKTTKTKHKKQEKADIASCHFPVPSFCFLNIWTHRFNIDDFIL